VGVWLAALRETAILPILKIHPAEESHTMPSPSYRLLTGAALAALLAACGPADDTAEDAVSVAEPEAATAAAEAPPPGPPSPSTRLAAVLAEQPEEVKARYEWRHPQETLLFFGIEPGMDVVEVLPGGGWYSRILLPYLGSDGTLIGADYALDMWPSFGFMDDEALAKKETWPEDWSAEASGWAGEDGAAVKAFQMGALPAAMEGSADAIVFIRALHNLARFEDEGGFLTEAVENAYRVLEPGGIAGVVQHKAPAGVSDDWADGNRGYLKEEFVISTFEAAGFEFVESSAINENPADQPGAEDIVWRLPPSLMTSRNDEEAAAAFRAIGESNRMTLKFRKPAEDA
jgi:predicted methyltransferase